MTKLLPPRSHPAMHQNDELPAAPRPHQHLNRAHNRVVREEPEQEAVAHQGMVQGQQGDQVQQPQVDQELQVIQKLIIKPAREKVKVNK